MYFAIKHSHMLMAVLSVFLLIFRFILQCRQSNLLEKKVLKVLPHVVDTLLLVTAVALMMTIQQYRFQNGWLTEKLVMVIAYIMFGFACLKWSQTIKLKSISLAAAIFCLLSVIHLAMSKQPMLLAS